LLDIWFSFWSFCSLSYLFFLL